MSKCEKQMKIPAIYMRGGTSKGVFFLEEDLPTDPIERDKVLLRVIGSPDPYGQQIDGMGAATSSTSKVVVISKSDQPGCDVNYLFGQVAIGQPLVDWSGNCGNLTSAVGSYAIYRGLIDVPQNGVATVNIWQKNIGKKIIAHVPMKDGEVVELGDFVLDGVAFPAAEIKLEFIDPGADDGDTDGGAMLPTGNPIDILRVPDVGELEVTLINAGNPAIFVSASSMGLTGTELQGDINSNSELLKRFEVIRAHGAVAMGAAESVEYAMTKRQHTPKIAFFSEAANYTTSDGKKISSEDINILVRILSMGKLHHAMTGTGAVAIAAAAAIPGTIVSRILGNTMSELRFGHPSGSLRVGAVAENEDKGWVVKKVVMSRSARRLMEGSVLIPKTIE
ncbi:2-methylaconitate cis-trans isomerase PrpF [Neobacillus vireti]|uniref:PrpF protein involved in 2-methylcitrate cycle n=1 Tax=Neobacillus vireti LMG 21834 TaxID=1131730 RepID=A0AB94IQE7_9BACI|nr:2-methylaconitate cis-trans isomerase PrpF [Neobacillus vireti]ETI69218.1 PrpF protein involved in 2-methylcitrate cycle [Neobacillus vireti LMG 21834]KLT18958.1 3-methylitaconate isomerase [Neobacillus vireti]